MSKFPTECVLYSELDQSVVASLSEISECVDTNSEVIGLPCCSSSTGSCTSKAFPKFCKKRK